MRPMVRTPEEFPRALAKKIEQNGGKRAVAARLGVTEGEREIIEELNAKRQREGGEGVNADLED